MITLNEVSKRYGEIEAVRKVSFEVTPGEIFGLLGPNGAGKTTLMRIITCYHYPSDGEVMINDRNIYDDAVAIKSEIGYLPEHAPLYAELNVYEYLRFMAEARGVPRERLQERIEWVVEHCGLEAVAYQSIDTISKGYRQRTGLAQAIIHDPPILILDEPTTGLDPNQIIEIRKLIRSLGQEKTVMLSTHILQEVEALCDRMVILNEGRVAAQGASAEIAAGMRKGSVYSVVFQSDGAGGVDDFSSRLATVPGIEQPIELQRLAGGSRGAARWGAEFVLGDSEGGEIIFDWAIKQNCKIIELSKKHVSLEDIFTRLTGTDAEGGTK